MKADVVSLRVFMVVLMGELLHYVKTDSQDSYTNEEYGQPHENPPPNNYNNYNNYYNTYDTNDKNPIEPEYPQNLPSTIACFTCTLNNKDGYTQGMPNCNDPFVRIDIPTVNCKGPCGKMYHQHGENDFLITRSCLPNCKEHRDDKSYVQCCTKPYCNTSSSQHTFSLTLWVVSVLLTICLTKRSYNSYTDL